MSHCRHHSKDYYTEVEVSRLYELEAAYELLLALERNGVEEWEGFNKSLQEAIEGETEW